MVGRAARIGLFQAGLALLLAVENAAAAELERQASDPMPAKVRRYAERLAARYDTDRDGRLTEVEWRQFDGNPVAADANQDGILSAEEFAQHIADFGRHRKIRLMAAGVGNAAPLPSLLPPDGARGNPPAAPAGAGRPELADGPTAELPGSAEGDAADQARQRKYVVSPSRLPPGLPDWFLKRDRDGDGQLTLAEYAELGSAAADREFARYDRNQDGLITPREVLGSAAEPRRQKDSPAAEPRRQKRSPAADSSPQPKAKTATDQAKAGA